LYYSHVYSVAFNISKSHTIAEDCIQDVFLIVWEKRANLVKVEDIKAYLTIITKNHCLKLLKLKTNTTIVDENYFFDFKTKSLDPESTLLNEEFQKIVLSQINDLPKKCREIFMLVKDKEMKYKEVANLLNISEKTVQAQLQIAYKRIKEVVKKYSN
jgi:RNA polymerase sigma-70 factor (ECF subfamily)